MGLDSITTNTRLDNISTKYKTKPKIKIKIPSPRLDNISTDTRNISTDTRPDNLSTKKIMYKAR